MKKLFCRIKERIKNATRSPRQVLRSFVSHRGTIVLLLLLLLFLIPLIVRLLPVDNSCQNYVLCSKYDITWGTIGDIIFNNWYQFGLSTILILLAIILCGTLTDIYSIKRKESAITFCQILILVLVGIWILGVYLIFGLEENHINKAVITGLGALFAWIFQDTIKGVVAFIHLRLNNQLHIDDWIKVPKQDVDGEVRRVSLTTVTISNWDTTTSCIPTSMLYSEHFVNLKNMMDGKTFGRRMFMTFILDTNWMHPLSKEEVPKLIKKLEGETDVFDYIPSKEIKEGQMNAQLFRLYLFHWLMKHPHISQQPRLMVRWQEQKESGMPLQVYAFIKDSGVASFEWQQSQIVEHILKALKWFGLRLFQTPSSFDVSNSNIFLTDSPAGYVD